MADEWPRAAAFIFGKTFSHHSSGVHPGCAKPGHAAGQETSTRPLQTMRLLVVEDEPDLLTVLLRALRKEGYAVDSAADGEEGLYKAQSTDYDAIVLDMMLPGLDGWEILSRLRKSKATPVLILTARDRTADRV